MVCYLNSKEQSEVLSYISGGTESINPSIKEINLSNNYNKQIKYMKGVSSIKKKYDKSITHVRPKQPIPLYNDLFQYSSYTRDSADYINKEKLL